MSNMPEFKAIIENNGNLIDNKNVDSSVNDSEPHFTYDPDMSNEEWEAMLKAALENYKKKKYEMIGDNNEC